MGFCAELFAEILVPRKVLLLFALRELWCCAEIVSVSRFHAHVHKVVHAADGRGGESRNGLASCVRLQEVKDRIKSTAIKPAGNRQESRAVGGEEAHAFFIRQVIKLIVLQGLGR